MMLERIHTLLKWLEWSRHVILAGGGMVETCPRCQRPPRDSGAVPGGHAADCELKACLDAIAREKSHE